MARVCSELSPISSHLHLSGKSNLMDAISFVLGEPTKSLRVRKLSVSLLAIRFHIHFIPLGINPWCSNQQTCW